MKPQARVRMDATVGIVILLTAAETGLIAVLLAEVIGPVLRATAAWPWLWAVGCLAYFSARALARVSAVLRVPPLAVAAVLSAIPVIHSVSYRGEALFSAGWLRDSIRAATLQPNPIGRHIPFVLVVVVALWLRQATRRPAGVEEAATLFRLGPILAVLLCLLVLSPWGTGSAGTPLLALHVAAFFGTAYLALSYARWTEATERSDAGLTSAVRSLSASALPLVLVLALTIVVAAMVAGQGEDVRRSLIGGAYQLVNGIALVISTVVRTIADAVVWFVNWLLSLLPGGPPSQPYQRIPREETQPRFVGELPFQSISWLAYVAVGLITVIIFALYKPRLRMASEAGVTHESAWRPPDVRGGVSSLLRRLRRGTADQTRDPLRDLLADPVWRHTGETRRAYRDAAVTYERAGHGRSVSQTPHEHAEREADPRLAELTALYHEARYSTRPITEDLARRARELEAEIEATRIATDRDNQDPGDSHTPRTE